MLFRNTLSFIFLFVCLILNAQDNTVTGVVTAFNRYTMEGVLVKAKKSKEIVRTDSLGYFEISCLEKDVVNISAVGFLGYRVKIKGDTKIKCNLIMLEKTSEQEKIIREGYLSEEEVAYAIENLMDENNDFYKYPTICDLLQAKFPSAYCSDVDGRNRVFLSKKPQSIMSGEWALCVVDGIVTEDISNIAPVQVRSIKVLSPGDAAVWGSRAGNGVLEITLKYK